MLETRNKKFKLPFVFIAGAIFLIGLAYFANYLEGLPQVETEVEKKKAKTIQIRVDKDATIFLNGTKIVIEQLEEQLKIQFDGYANPVISLEASAEVSAERLLKIMDIATKNKYTIILGGVSK
ncbi:biopolymer transporter ExbD [Kordia sp. SMS9]|uniref:ExbD/TolR family protein n=1 Tax=Kordia sp. SMS9 TaxID=2282170 RepID=UPI0013B3C491|nr:biopolymer transporter ExbD [Kordia sp. SMS9]